jgi:RNA polymerase sigma-70 factor (ECF subfamily)
MKRTAVCFFIGIQALCCFMTPPPIAAQEDYMTPVVVRTVPRAGDTAVDPKLREIAVTFSKEMETRNSWSWVAESKETFPKLAGRIHFVNKRTCLAPVHLEPGKTYRIWLNSGKSMNFRDKDGNPAVPYLLEFRTRK